MAATAAFLVAAVFSLAFQPTGTSLVGCIHKGRSLSGICGHHAAPAPQGSGTGLQEFLRDVDIIMSRIADCMPRVCEPVGEGAGLGCASGLALVREADGVEGGGASGCGASLGDGIRDGMGAGQGDGGSYTESATGGLSESAHVETEGRWVFGGPRGESRWPFPGETERQESKRGMRAAHHAESRPLKEPLPRDMLWEQLFTELMHYRQMFGHARVPQETTGAKSFSRLASWVSRQRLWLRRSVLRPERYDRLAAAGMVWEHNEDTWEVSYQRLQVYHQTFGHTNVPQHDGGLELQAAAVQEYKGNDEAKHAQSLGTWVAIQRLMHKRGKLRKDRVFRLSLLTFQWEIRHDWETNYHELLLLRQNTGKCKPPAENKSLRRWVEMQKNLMSCQKAPHDKARLLEAVGVGCSPRGENWETLFVAVACFRMHHGHLKFSEEAFPLQALASLLEDRRVVEYMPKWLAQQRHRYQIGLLKESRRERLEGIGFPVSSSKSFWNVRFAELMRYRDEHGSTNVPTGWGENPVLARWVQHQRKAAKSGRLDPERRDALEGVDFVWEAANSPESQLRYQISNSKTHKPRRKRANTAIATEAFPCSSDVSFDTLSYTATSSSPADARLSSGNALHWGRSSSRDSASASQGSPSPSDGRSGSASPGSPVPWGRRHGLLGRASVGKDARGRGRPRVRSRDASSAGGQEQRRGKRRGSM